MPAKKTLRELQLSGALKHNPQRYTSRVTPRDVAVGPLGPAPRHLSKDAQAIWREIVKGAPDGLLKSSDRLLLEIAVTLTLKMRAGVFKNSELSLLSSTLGKLGLTPVDRNKVELPEAPQSEKEQNDPWADAPV